MKEGGWFWDLLAERYDKQTPKDENYARAVDRFARNLRLSRGSGNALFCKPGGVQNRWTTTP